MEDVDVWEDPSGVPSKWLAFSDETLVFGFGDDRDSALDDYRNNCNSGLVRLLELGPERVTPSLWATVPALQKTLGLSQS